MDADTLRRLEFDRILAELERWTHCPPAAQRARELRPVADPDACERLQEETAEARALLDAGRRIPLEGLGDPRPLLARAARGGVLSGPELLDVARSAEAMAALRAALDAAGAGPRLRERAAALPDARELVRAVRAAVADDGSLRDDASPELRALRARVRELGAELRRRLEALVRSPSLRPYLQEPVVTLRGGRAVVPVRSEHRARVPGLVHDVSESGATLFVEPLVAVELGNRLREAEAQARREEERVLARLSRRVGEQAEALARGIEAAAELDLIFARARLAQEQRATRPRLGPGRAVVLREARHPLLGPGAVPIDVTLGVDFDVLVITGPNTGGKTVALKTIGLLALMAQAGLQVPAAEARLPVFRRVVADIGDEQSLEQSLSTFAAHLRVLVAALRDADPGTLVLIDELGAGTDPDEGAALGMALLEALQARGSLVVATTHIGRLKAYAFQRPRAANAAVEFDPVSLRPTYRLRVGMPGRSHALTVARRLGVPEEVVRRAEAYVGEAGRRLEEILAELEARWRELDRERAEAARARAEAERLRGEWERRLRELEERRRHWLDVVRAELTARLNRWQEEAEELVVGLRAAAQRGELATGEALLGRLRALRGAVREALAEAEREAGAGEGAAAPAPAPGEWRAGQPVWVRPLGQVGVLVEVPRPGRLATVQVGAARVRVAPDELAPAPAGAAATEPGPPAEDAAVRLGLQRARQVSPELHLRGLTVDEALAQLDRYLDDAVLAGLSRVRIVHGKGTGALRKAVHHFLQRDARVRAFRLGEPGEGGAGVTVAEL